MSATSAALAGRRMAERLMLDTVTIEREDPDGVPDEVTGVVPLVPSVTVYSGRAKVQTQDQYERTPEAGGHTFTEQRYYVHVPVGSYAPQIGDMVTVTVATLDPNLHGPFRVVALLHKSLATAYRLAVTDQVA